MENGLFGHVEIAWTDEATSFAMRYQ